MGDASTHPHAHHGRRASKVQQLNQMSAAPVALARRSVDQVTVVDVSDPVSAESPRFSPSSRNDSATSVKSLTASRKVDSQSLSPSCSPQAYYGPTQTSEHGTHSFPSTSTSASASSSSLSSSITRHRATTLDVPGLTRSKVSPDGRIAKRDVAAKLVIVMVGLPARGKSYITKKLSRYLNWQQHDCRVFNVGNTRRRANTTLGPATRPLPDEDAAHQSGDFFAPDNQQSVAQRELWAEETLHELLDYVLDGEGSVGILDATNTTRARRRTVMNIIKERSGGDLKILFLESVCTQRHIIEANARLKLSGPDYKHMDEKKAIEDFLLRLRNYEKAYEPIGPEEEADPNFQYIKMINVGQKIECGNIKGFLAGQTVFFLLNFNLADRQIWITRHGESEDNQKGKIGGDAGLTDRGRKYARALARFMRQTRKEFRKRQLEQLAKKLKILQESGSHPPTPLSEPENQNFCVWTSMLRRSVDTAAWFDETEFDLKEMRMLNELDSGVCEGMTYEEIRTKFPTEYAARMRDKIRYRYPGVGGESYLDVINRLRPVIVEIERMEDNCLVICHRVVARVLLSYFLDLGRDAIGDLEVPLHTLYLMEPKPYGVDWAMYKYNERLDDFVKIPKESANVKAQLRDHKRRYTVVATAGIQLGDCSEAADSAAVADSSSDDDEDHTASDLEIRTHPRSGSSLRDPIPETPSLEEAVSRTLHIA